MRETHTHNLVQYDDSVTIALEFTDINASPEELLGSCVVNDVSLNDTGQTKICELTLHRRAVVSGNLLAVLGVSVMNEAGEPVAGASVYDGTTLLGLTNSGSFGTEGYLKHYLTAGGHTIRAEDTAGGKLGEAAIIVSAAGISNLEIILSQDLTPLWSGTQQSGSSGDDYGLTIDRDTADNFYVAGHTNADLDGNTNAGEKDLFLIKYNSGGVKQWTQQIGTAADEFVYGVSVDSNGNIYVAGRTQGGLDGNTNAGSDDIFLIKYDSNGVKQWTRQMGNRGI